MESGKWQVKTIQKLCPLFIVDKEKIKSYSINLSKAASGCGVRPRICTNKRIRTIVYGHSRLVLSEFLLILRS